MEARTVGEAMARPHALRVTPETTVRDAARLMAEHKCGSVLVMEGERLAGIFTERDVLWRVVTVPLDAEKTPVSAVMTREPDTIDVGEPVAEALRRMDRFGYWHLPVRQGEEVVGVVSIRDLPLGTCFDVQQELEQRHELAERMW
jgi:CBS domain-containing protein